MRPLIFVRQHKLIHRTEGIIKRSRNAVVVTDNDDIIDYMNSKSCELIVMNPDFPLLAKETWQIIDIVNEIIKSAKTYNKPMLYEMNYLIEGGVTNLLHDLLYSIAFFLPIVEERVIDTIICDDSCKEERIALEVIATSKKIIYKRMSYRFLVLQDICMYNRFIRLNREIYYLFKAVINKLRCCDVWRTSDCKRQHKKHDIGYLLIASTPKRVKWLLDELERKRTVFDTCILCKGIIKTGRNLKKTGYDIEQIDAYGKLSDYIYVFINYKKDKNVLFNLLDSGLTIDFCGLDISNIIAMLAKQYIVENSLNNGFCYLQMNDLFQQNKYSLITAQGDSNFISTRIAKKVTRDLNQNTLFYRELRELIMVDSSRFDVYEPYSNVFDFRIYNPNNEYLRKLIESGWSGEYYLCAIDEDEVVVNIHNDSENKIHEGTRILWAPSYVARGFYSTKEYLDDCVSVISRISGISGGDVVLTVKNHPNQEHRLDEWLYKECKKHKHIVFVNKRESVYELIERSDLVITTPSTILLDCAKAKKPVICLTNNQQKVKHLLDYFYIIRNVELDPSHFMGRDGKRLINKMLILQKRYLEEMVFAKTTYSEIDILKKKLKEVS